jgi:hypothetical protein
MFLDKVVPTLQPEEEGNFSFVRKKHFSEAFTPPTTGYGPIVRNEVAVQTEEASSRRIFKIMELLRKNTSLIQGRPAY